MVSVREAVTKINVDSVNVDDGQVVTQDGCMTTLVDSTEAARLLGVTRATLYAYVSRGKLGRRTAIDGRTSLFSLDEIEALQARTRSGPRPRPSIDVRITSAVTTLSEDGLLYRGHAVDELARTASFEQVAELLWGGVMPPPGDVPAWPAGSKRDGEACRELRARGHGSLHLLAATCLDLATRYPHETARDAARLLIGLAPRLLGGDAVEGGTAVPQSGSMASRLAAAWHPEPSSELVAAIDRALVLLADHELATSTLAVRVAGSVRADPWSAFTAGLSVLQAPLHGSAAAVVYGLFTQAELLGPAQAITDRLMATRRLPGYGHAVYPAEDPRLAPLLEAVRVLPDPERRLTVVEDVLSVAAGRVPVQPNVDFGLAALAYVGGLQSDVPLFAVARLAGWVAHLEEELAESPLRFRGVARPAVDA